MNTRFFIAIIIITLSSFSFTEAQMKIIRKGDDGKRAIQQEDIFDLPELASIIMYQDGKLVVDNVFEKQMRPKENESADIQQGDVILMMNGKRVKSLKDLKDSYTTAAIGSEVKLGVERNKETAIVSFVKMDPDKLPKKKIMINRDGGSDGHDIMIIPGTGLLIGSKGKEVVVDNILSDLTSTLKDADVHKGDMITAVNDTKVTSFDEFSRIFKQVPVGETVTFHTSRKGKPLSFSFTKAEGGKQRVIKREND